MFGICHSNSRTERRRKFKSGLQLSHHNRSKVNINEGLVVRLTAAAIDQRQLLITLSVQLCTVYSKMVDWQLRVRLDVARVGLRQLILVIPTQHNYAHRISGRICSYAQSQLLYLFPVSSPNVYKSAVQLFNSIHCRVVIANSHRPTPTRRNSIVELSRVGRCELAIKRPLTSSRLQLLHVGLYSHVRSLVLLRPSFSGYTYLFSRIFNYQSVIQSIFKAVMYKWRNHRYV